jgi:SAM-dependent methyltransferase
MRQDTSVFPEAARGMLREQSFVKGCILTYLSALAMKLVSAANLKKDGRVLGKCMNITEYDVLTHRGRIIFIDVGHGTGESLILLLSKQNVPRQATLTGVTSILEHSRRSLQRVKDLQNTVSEARATKVELYHGDAVYRDIKDATSNEHPFAEGNEPFDSILVLDCAYHFNTRHLFLEQALAHLAPGGTIALADICFSSSSLGSLYTRVLTKVLRMMPQANVISDSEYISQMQDLGYQDVILENVTADVYPGFVKFLKSRGGGWYVFGCIMSRFARAGAQFVIVSGRKK